MFKYAFTGYYHTFSYAGRAKEYPYTRYNARQAWADFYRDLRYWKEI